MFKWFRREAPQPDPLLSLLVEQLRTQNEAQTRLMERMIEAQKEQAAQNAEMMQSFVSLWKPTREPLTSSMDERALAKEADEKAWQPIAFNVFEQLDRDLGVPEEFLRD